MAQQTLATKYTGSTARDYLRDRSEEPHWPKEQAIVRQFLADTQMPAGSLVVDVPVGTGRFFPFYIDRGYKVVGYDISPDMLSEARKYGESTGCTSLSLEIADIENIPAESNAADIVLCIRYMQHVDIDGLRKALDELARITNRFLIVGVHVTVDRSQYVSNASKLVLNPADTIHSALNMLKRRLRNNAPPQSESSDGSFETIDFRKEENAVVAAFAERGLKVRDERLVLASLNLLKPIHYKIYLLEKPSYSDVSLA